MARRFATGMIDAAHRRDSRANRFAENTYFHSVRANRLEPAIRNVLVPRNAIHKKRGFSSGTLRGGDSRESANRFTRIGPSKFSNVETSARGDASESWPSQVMLYNLKVDTWPPNASLFATDISPQCKLSQDIRKWESILPY